MSRVLDPTHGAALSINSRKAPKSEIRILNVAFAGLTFFRGRDSVFFPSLRLIAKLPALLTAYQMVKVQARCRAEDSVTGLRCCIQQSSTRMWCNGMSWRDFNTLYLSVEEMDEDENGTGRKSRVQGLQ